MDKEIPSILVVGGILYMNGKVLRKEWYIPPQKVVKKTAQVVKIIRRTHLIRIEHQIRLLKAINILIKNVGRSDWNRADQWKSHKVTSLLVERLLPVLLSLF
ncbi:hypothetical protein [Gracilibacillus phocaeensis]|uniref:hypothetical protein n=1 Tax=Gracilibacillus phocaeensis TaxID=2042304 RepID=UPI0013EF48DF|nr:hypothetical protein [Gracilibacillus phocaeensis]